MRAWSEDFVGYGAASGAVEYHDIHGLPLIVDATHVVALRTDGGPGKTLELYDGEDRRLVRIASVEEAFARKVVRP